jgi:hypothetical protein
LIHKNSSETVEDITFTPKKKAKGIVYYNERQEELIASPELAQMSSGKATEETLASPTDAFSSNTTTESKTNTKRRKRVVASPEV